MSGNNFNQFLFGDDGRFIILANLKAKPFIKYSAA